MINSIRGRCLYLSEEECPLLNIRKAIVESKNPRPFGALLDEEEHEKREIVDVTGFDENEDAGCYDL